MRILIALLSAATMQAATSTLTPASFGFYNNNGGHFANNHATGWYPTAQPPGEIRSYLVFNLGAAAGKVTSAKLRLFNPSSGYNTPDASETFAVFDVNTAAATLTGGSGAVAAFNDLGTGTQLGTVTVTNGVSNTVVEITLNSQGIAYLNAAGAQAVLGGALTSINYNGPSQYLFNSASGTMTRELVVTYDDNTPCTFSLASSSVNVPAGGGGASVQLNNVSGTNCAWGTSNVNSWITLSPLNGVGSTTINITALANPAGTARSATVTIAGQTLTINQTGFGTSTSTALRFVSLTPCRLVETRPEYNFEGRVSPFGPPFLAANETRTFAPPSSKVCNVPASAKAYVVNVTLVPKGSGVDHVTLFPAGEAKPDYWTVRSPDGQIVANSAIVKAGNNGALSLFASNDTDVLVDISGYFTDNAQVSNLVFYPLTPCRVIETRAAYRPQAGTFGPPSLAAKTARTFPLPQSTDCQIPSGASAYSVTITVVPPAGLPFLTAWPTGLSQPNVSSINSPAGRIVANSVIVPAGTNGAINLYAFEATDVIVDINGYFAPDNGNGYFFYPVTQCRMSNSSDATYPIPFGNPIYGDTSTRTMPVLSSNRCTETPTTARAYALNVTVMPNGNPMPFLTVWPSGQSQPNASVVNAFQGQTVSSGFIVPAGTAGSVDIFAFRQTHVALEMSGYFGR